MKNENYSKLFTLIIRIRIEINCIIINVFTLS